MNPTQNICINCGMMNEKHETICVYCASRVDTQTRHEPDSIREYYAEIDQKQASAFDRLRVARKAGKPRAEIKRLKEAAEDAGSTGD